MKVVIRLTDACNLSCDYCYLKRRGPCRRPSARAILSALEIVRSRRDREPHDIVFFGGEPFLRFDLMKEVVRLHPDCRFTVNTNGTLVDAPIADFMAARNVTVSLALDGGPAVHDGHRRTAAGKPTHAVVKKAFDRLVHAGVATAVRMTVTPETAGALGDQVRYLRSIGAERLGIAPAVNVKWGRAAVAALGDGMMALAAVYPSPSLPRIFDFEKAAAGGGAGCRPGVDTVTIDPAGDVFPCHRSAARGAAGLVIERHACAACVARPYCTMCVPKLGASRPGPRCALKLAMASAYDMIRTRREKRRASMEKYTVINGKVYKIPPEVLNRYRLTEEEARRLEAAGKAPKGKRAEPPLKGNWYELGESDCF